MFLTRHILLHIKRLLTNASICMRNCTLKRASLFGAVLSYANKTKTTTSTKSLNPSLNGSEETLGFVPGDNSRGPRTSSHVSASLHHVRRIGGELSGNLHLSQCVATATASSTAAHKRKHASGLSPVSGSSGVITSATTAFHTTTAYVSYVSLVNVKKGAEKTVTTSTDWPEHVPMLLLVFGLGVCLLQLPNRTPTIVSLSVAA